MNVAVIRRYRTELCSRARLPMGWILLPPFAAEWRSHKAKRTLATMHQALASSGQA